MAINWVIKTKGTTIITEIPWLYYNDLSEENSNRVNLWFKILQKFIYSIKGSYYIKVSNGSLNAKFKKNYLLACSDQIS